MDPLFQTAEALLMAEIFGGKKGWKLSDASQALGTRQDTVSRAYTHLNITGSGFLTTLEGGGFWTVIIDGGTPWIILGTSNHMALMMPFKTSLVVKSDSAPSSTVNASALLDGGKTQWSRSTFVTSKATGATHQSLTLLNVAGSGVLLTLMAFSSTIYDVTVEADNSGTRYSIPMSNAYHGPVIVPFRAAMIVTTSAPSGDDVWLTYLLD